MTQYADDINGFVSDLLSARLFLTAVDEFGTITGLILNKEKTEAMWLGKNRNSKNAPLGISWPDTPIRILGVYITYDQDMLIQYNLDDKVLNMKKVLNCWKARNLSLKGKCLIVKSLGLSKLQYSLSFIPAPKRFLKEVEKAVFQFIWSDKKDKIKRTVLIADYADGGLRAPDIESIVLANRVGWIKRYLCDADSGWKYIADAFCEQFGGLRFLLTCDYKTELLSGYIPAFYKEILKAWSIVHKGQHCCLWNNKNVRINEKSFFWRHLDTSGIRYISDIFHHNGQVKQFEHVSEKIGKTWLFKWMGLVYAVPKYMKLFKSDENYNCSLMTSGNKTIIILTASARQIYDLIVKRKITTPTGQLEWNRLLNLNESIIDWSQIYTLAANCAYDEKNRVFQYKLLNNILAVKQLLQRWRITNTNTCSLCNSEPETCIHIFAKCKCTLHFWNEFERFWTDKTSENLKLNDNDIIFGVLSQTKHWISLNYCILQAKQFIFEQKNKERLPFALFVDRLKHFQTIEKSIAKKTTLYLDTTKNGKYLIWNKIIISR